MTKFLIYGWLLWCAVGAWGQSVSPILLKNVNVVALGGGVEQTGRDVLLENGKIAALRPANNKPFPGIEQIDATGKWLIPGLIDMHALVAGTAEDSLAQREALAELLAMGVTSILEVSGAGAPATPNAEAAPHVFWSAVLLPAAAAPSRPWPGTFYR